MFFNKFPKTQYDFYLNNRFSEIPNIFRQVRVSDRRFETVQAYQLYEISEERPDQLSQKLYGTTDFYWTFFVINEKLQGGMNSWPLGYSELIDFIDDKYPNKVIRPYRVAEDDINYNSITGKFEVGHSILGQTSGATGTILSRDINTNQLVFSEDSGTFIEGESLTINGVINAIVDKYEIREEKGAIHSFVDADNNPINNYENLQSLSNIVTFQDYEKELNDSQSTISVIRDQYVEEFAIIFRRIMNG